MLFSEKCTRKNNIVINILQKKIAYEKPARQKSKSKFKNAMHKKEII